MTKIDDDYQFIETNIDGKDQLIFSPTAKKVGNKLVLSVYNSEYMRKKIRWCWGYNFSKYVESMLDSDRLPKS